MISVKSTVNVQSVSENNQLTISIVFNQIKCGSNKLKPESISNTSEINQLNNNHNELQINLIVLQSRLIDGSRNNYCLKKKILDVKSIKQ